MRKICSFILACTIVAASAQSNKKAKMAAIFVPGYYINNKNDTVRGQVQINPEDPTDFYRQFAFISGRSKKPKVFVAGQTKAYGFDGRNFVTINSNEEKLFAERLTHGRLRFYEYRFNGKVNGAAAVESDYFIRDMYANDQDAALKEPKRLSQKFYKKALRPYMQDQPMLWSDLDKYAFDRNKVVQTIKEFNRFYASTSN